MDPDNLTLALRDFVAGLDKGLQVIEAFDQERSRLTNAEIAERTGPTRAAARRYLLTLTALGYMCHEQKQFSLTPKGTTPRPILPALGAAAAHRPAVAVPARLFA